MKKSILIHYSIFNTGGAERSTLKLMNAFLDRGINVELLLNIKGGDFESHIDPRVKISYLRSGDFLSKGKAKSLIPKFFYLVLYIFSKIEEILNINLLRLKAYDLVIIGLHGLSPSISLKYVRAKKHIQYIRNDLMYCDPNKKAYNNIIRWGEQIDHYICVSGTAYDSFCSIFPQFKNKAITIYNLLESDRIIEKAGDSLSDSRFLANENIFKLLTVCRIQDKSKGVFRMVNVARSLKKEGYTFKWYVIGDGVDFLALKSLISDYDLGEYIILLGSKQNPYPYFKHVDLVAVLSYYEGLCGVVNEAKMLERPLIATEFSGIFEQIESGSNGIIVENNEQSILKAIRLILDKPQLLSEMYINGMPEAIRNDNLKIDQIMALI